MVAEVHAHAFAEEFELVELFDGPRGGLRAVELQEGEGVEAVLVFFHVQLTHAPESLEETSQLPLDCFLGLRAVDVCDEDLPCVFDGLPLAGG